MTHRGTKRSVTQLKTLPLFCLLLFTFKNENKEINKSVSKRLIVTGQENR